MEEILDVAIPAVVLIPIILIGIAVWIGLNYNAKSSYVRKAEFMKLQRMAAEEHERAEREFEQEYSLQRQADPYRVDYRRRESGENEYRKPVQPQVQQEGWRQPDLDIRRRRQIEEEEYHRRQFEADLYSRRMQAEAAERRRREAAEDEIKRRKAEERERERRKAELEAHLRKEAEEERRRKAEDEANWRRKEEEARRREVGNKDVHPPSNLYCLVCDKPTKRRCSRCKSAFYCSKECQVQHWKGGHKNECRPPDVSSPRGSEVGSEFLGD